MKDEIFVYKVREMRKAQKAYKQRQRTHNWGNAEEKERSIRYVANLERLVDDMLETKTSTPQTLFKI